MIRAMNIFMLALGLTLGGFPSAYAAPQAAHTPRASWEVVADFPFTLKPGEWHGWTLGPVSDDGTYIAEVSPSTTQGVQDGSWITSRVQQEFSADLQAWSDVLRVQLLPATTNSVDVMIRVYAVAPK
jgi:hypothetical protein